MNCALCDEPLTGKRTKYCSETCSRVSERRVLHKRQGLAGVINEPATCTCGKVFLMKRKSHRFCSKACAKATYKKEVIGVTRPLGELFTCVVCDEQIERTSAVQKYCQHKCTPPAGHLIECIACHEHRSYDNYYDYREDGGGNGFKGKCNICISNERHKSKRILVTGNLKTRKGLERGILKQKSKGMTQYAISRRFKVSQALVQRVIAKACAVNAEA